MVIDHQAGAPPSMRSESVRLRRASYRLRHHSQELIAAAQRAVGRAERAIARSHLVRTQSADGIGGSGQ